MNILSRLTLRHLALNRRRTIITIIGILLSVAMVTAVSGLVVSFQDLLYQDAVASSGLWHVKYWSLDEETAEQIAADPLFFDPIREEDEEGINLSLQFKTLHKGIFDESEELCQRLGIKQEQVSYHNDLLIAKGILPGPYYNALYGFASILLVLVAAGSILVISNAFTISADQRSVQFGLLKSAGATKRQIRNMVLFEGVALAAVSIPLGILAGLAAQWVALAVANYVFDRIAVVNFLVRFRVMMSPLALAVSVGAALLTILAAAWGPAKRAAKASPVEAIRQTRTVKISPRSLRVSPLTPKLFGFEGLLAAKTLKRNRSKYQTTVLSLVVSIVLFIGVSSFGEILIKATGMAYIDLGSNLIVNLYGTDHQGQDRVAEEMASWEGVDAYPVRQARLSTDLPEEAWTPMGLEYFTPGPTSVYLFSMKDSAFDALCASLGRNPTEYRNPDDPKAVLINTTGTFIVEGRRTNFVPFRIANGTVLPLKWDETTAGVTIQGSVSEVPPGILLHFAAGRPSLIVSSEVLDALSPPNVDYGLSIALMAEDADSTENRIRAYLEEAWPDYSVHNYEAMAANSRHFGYLVMFFVYGFIAMLSLVGVTSVITTISTSISLRRREFAMLRSVGMTEGGIRRMLNLESLLYGVKALVLGIPLGFLVSRLMYHALGVAMDFEFSWPLTSALISVAAVLILTFATMTFARGRQRKDNIVGALRDDVV